MEEDYFFEEPEEVINGGEFVVLSTDVWKHRSTTSLSDLESESATGWKLFSCKDYKLPLAECLFYQSNYIAPDQVEAIIRPPVEPELWPIATIDGFLPTTILVFIAFLLTGFAIFGIFHRFKVNFKNFK